MFKFLFSFFITQFFLYQASCQVSLPALISDNMVLQQKTNVSLWGTARNKSLVEISPSWTKKKYSSKVDDRGNWKIKVPTPHAGGPYQISFNNNGDHLTIKNVYIGEVLSLIHISEPTRQAEISY